jgi:ATP-dependent exoDNAse (exonuclease V) beta subunit
MMPKAHVFFLNRNLMYVGVTRAKERVYLITTQEVIQMALRQEATLARNTFLKNKIKEVKTLVDKGEIKWYNNLTEDKEGVDTDEYIEGSLEIDI